MILKGALPMRPKPLIATFMSYLLFGITGVKRVES